VNEDIYKALAEAKVGYIISPAGCGKTEAIVQAIKKYCVGTQLILTHTHAGVAALKKRLKDNDVSRSLYHIETISGWALNWVRHYSQLSGFSGTLPIPKNDEWSSLYKSAQSLLSRSFVQWVIGNSYSGIIVDEYQDCTASMHDLIKKLKKILPCRVLGDPLQGIFGFNEPLVEWNNVEKDFENQIGELVTPHRWINVNNETLGNWLINVRSDFQKSIDPNYKLSPVICENVDVKDKAKRLQALARQLQGSVCIIGSKHGKGLVPLGSALINVGFTWVEPNDLPDLQKFLSNVFNANTVSLKAEAAIDFIKKSFTGLEKHKDFVTKILSGNLKRKPIQENRQKLYEQYQFGYSPQLLLELIGYLDLEKIKRKKHDSIDYLKRVVGWHIDTGEDVIEIFTKEIARRKIIGKNVPKRCIGTTLLLKGLEFDHAVILYDQGDGGWKNMNDIYVALTRGCKSVYIIQ
jgi:hypothetical protein